MALSVGSVLGPLTRVAPYFRAEKSKGFLMGLTIIIMPQLGEKL